MKQFLRSDVKDEVVVEPDELLFKTRIFQARQAADRRQRFNYQCLGGLGRQNNQS